MLPESSLSQHITTNSFPDKSIHQVMLMRGLQELEALFPGGCMCFIWHVITCAGACASVHAPATTILHAIHFQLSILHVQVFMHADLPTNIHTCAHNHSQTRTQTHTHYLPRNYFAFLPFAGFVSDLIAGGAVQVPAPKVWNVYDGRMGGQSDHDYVVFEVRDAFFGSKVSIWPTPAHHIKHQLAGWCIMHRLFS